MARSGFRRGVDLLPWPDGLEYAAAAVNLDRGLGPVLHFGDYSYPSRYTEGYPLILAAAYPILGGRVERLCLATIATAMVAVAMLYILASLMFGRASAFFAGLLLAASPLFATYSTLVLSDVPTLAVTLMAALALFHASAAEDAPLPPPGRIALAALCGALAGFTVMIRPTNALIIVGLGASLFAVPPLGRSGGILRAAIAFAVGFAGFPAWQAIQNYRYLGGPLRSGYVFWVPEVYGSMGVTFGAQFLFGPTMPGNPHGNLISYLLTVAGLDGMLGDPGDPRYLVYPFAGAAFAIFGTALALRKSDARAVLRVTWFGLSFFAALLAAYLFYFFTEVAFLLPGMFIIFAAAGYGIVAANLALRATWARVRKSARDLVVIVGVVALDLILAFSMLAETASRVAVSPRPSKMAPALLGIGSLIEPDAAVVSNISLQFLELYLAKPRTTLIGLNSFDPGGEFTDYHLSRLYAKRSAGWRGPVPPVLFAGQRIDDAEVKSLTAAARGGKPVYLLMTAAENPDYADLIKDEADQLSVWFALDPVAQSDPVELYRLKPR